MFKATVEGYQGGKDYESVDKFYNTLKTFINEAKDKERITIHLDIDNSPLPKPIVKKKVKRK